MSKILVVNYNTGNVRSVIKALKLFNSDVIFSNNKNDLDRCTKIVLPGQGSYDHAMKELDKIQFIDKIKNKSSEENIPILGICLGMQILSDFGYENNTKTTGLGIISGEVKILKSAPDALPNIGWREVNIIKKNKILENVKNKRDFYFIHSYKFVPTNIVNIMAESYCNENYASIIYKENVYGMQFHPEKSLGDGIKILENFVKLK